MWWSRKLLRFLNCRPRSWGSWCFSQIFELADATRRIPVRLQEVVQQLLSDGPFCISQHPRGQLGICFVSFLPRSSKLCSRPFLAAADPHLDLLFVLPPCLCCRRHALPLVYQLLLCLIVALLSHLSYPKKKRVPKLPWPRTFAIWLANTASSKSSKNPRWRSCQIPPAPCSVVALQGVDQSLCYLGWNNARLRLRTPGEASLSCVGLFFSKTYWSETWKIVCHQVQKFTFLSICM